MNQTIVTATVCLGEDQWLALEEFASACEATPDFIEALLLEGVLQPARPAPDLGFGGEELARVRRLKRLMRDFDASLAAAAVMLDLLDEIEHLRGQLRRVGL